jgi:hypothetical protein
MRKTWGEAGKGFLFKPARCLLSETVALAIVTLPQASPDTTRIARVYPNSGTPNLWTMRHKGRSLTWLQKGLQTNGGERRPNMSTAKRQTKSPKAVQKKKSFLA